MELLCLELHDHKGTVLKQHYWEETLEELKDRIHHIWFVVREDQLLFFEDKRELNGLGSTTLTSLGLKDGNKVIVKHVNLEHWEQLLEYSETINDEQKPMNTRRTFARKAIELSEMIDNTTLFLAYSFDKQFTEIVDQAMRLLDRLQPAFKHSALKYFAKNQPGSSVEFESKKTGKMAGVIAIVKTEDNETRYYIKTYHRFEEVGIATTGDRFPLNLIEIFIYRLLNHIGVGPKVNFLHYSGSIDVSFIMTEEVSGLKLLKDIEDQKKKEEEIVEAYLLRLILGITDVSKENIGVDGRNMLSIVDFRPPYCNILREDITNEFKNENEIDIYDVNVILREIKPEKRVEIAKEALNRWDGLRTVTSAIIDEKKEVYLLRLILGITDLNDENFGTRKRLSVIDFCPPRGDSFLQPSISNDFKYRSKIDHLEVNEVLREISCAKRVEIAKSTLDKWIKLKDATTELIAEDVKSLTDHRIAFEDDAKDLQKYITDIRKNYETLRSGLNP
uniref:Protein kinase domain-containing protein n=1 Tax=Caenorhabditis tropicalis TaxID=1561998 RepID=A0A1I7UXC9_9PELO